MRKSFVALLLLAGAAVLMANPVLADRGDDGLGLKLYNAQDAQERFSKATNLGTSVSSTDPETIWVGYWSGATTTNNWWKVGGTAGGTGGLGNRPPNNTDGTWTFEANQQVHGDSLSGWWPIRAQHANFSGATLTDENRPWWAPSFGNIANYMIVQPSAQRTFGVTGVWHRDAGSSATQVIQTGGRSATAIDPQQPAWSPLGGGHSAWMGLRGHGDITYSDPETGNPFNSQAVMFDDTTPASSGQTDRLLPGYVSYMDQMLYRTLDLSSYAGGGITVRFKYEHTMSNEKVTVDRNRTGWYEGDGLSLNQDTPGNFISAEADGGTGIPNTEGPVDSFQVYIGVPVEGTWKTSLHPFDVGDVDADGRRTIQDPQRRWFNEILDKGNRLWIFGDNGRGVSDVPGTTGGTATLAISHANVQALLDSAAALGQSGKLRLVFRVHTNQAFDDSRGSVPGNYNSAYRGAAVIDDVELDIGGGGFNLVGGGDFEAAGSIDNNVGTNPSAENAWRSTGKPPQSYFHTHDINTLIYQDICGPVGGQARICDMQGVVISMGLHDDNEKSVNDNALSSEHNGYWGMVSPVMNIAGADQTSKSTSKNNNNLTPSERWATDDYWFYWEIYTGYFDVFATGQIYQFGVQAYPADQSDGTEDWSQITLPTFLNFNPSKQCYAQIEGGFLEGVIRTTNANGVPDSLRLWVSKISQCYRFGVTTACAATDGGYHDNMALAIVDGTPTLLSAGIWDLYNDAFPANETASLPGTAAFDTAAAHIKIGLNVAQTTGDLFRYNVPGDSLVIAAAGDSVRIDLMFRIDPGVGNYVTIGDKTSGLRGNPTSAAPHAAGHFWGSYKANPGAFSGLPGTPSLVGAINAHQNAPTSNWNPTVWNSARMDTSEASGHATFPVQIQAIGNPPGGEEWSGTYHETELAARASLGITRNRCFVIDTLVSNIQDPNLNCGSKVPYPPAWVTTVPQSRTGWNGLTTTQEGTKILPDGLFTPGTHVQYFVRRQDLENPTSTFAMMPDTGKVTPQSQEGPNTDGHRWQQFAVLPNRWNALIGAGQACLLVFDQDDRRGNERVWKGVADSIGATSAAAVGNADGYGGVPGTNGGTTGANSINDPAFFIAGKNAQPGTSWDMYQQKASESLTTSAARIGGRLGYRAPGFLMDDGVANGFGTGNNGKWTYQPPTVEMLEVYYRLMLVMTGDVTSQLWGPFADGTADDIATFQGWLGSGSTTAPGDRGILVIGQAFAEASAAQGPPQSDFVSITLASDFTDPNYLLFVPDSRAFVDIKVGSSISPSGDTYGVNNSCLLENDVLAVNTAVPEAFVNLEYVRPDLALEPVGILKPHDPARPWTSQTIGVEIEAMRGRFGASNGRLAWMFNTLDNVFGSLCTVVGTPVVTLDTPQTGTGSQFVNFMNLHNNPLRSGQASIRFGLATDDFVQVKVFDVSGRLVRTLADRKFKAGEHALVWDGVDNLGRQLPRGVYFTQLRYRDSGYEVAKKLTILR